MTEQDSKTKTYSVMVQGGEVKISASEYGITEHGVLEFFVRGTDGRNTAVAAFPSWRWVMEVGVEVKA